MSIRHRVVMMMKKAIAAISSVTLTGVSTPDTYNTGNRSYTGSVVGGAPPYTYRLRQNTTVIDTQVTSATSASLNFPTNFTWGGLFLNVQVTDSAAQVLASSDVFLDLLYNFGLTISGSASTATAGAAIVLYSTLNASTGGSYAWYYRASNNGGVSWTAWSFFGSSDGQFGQFTGAHIAGERYEYYATYTRAGVTTTSNTITSQTV